MNAAYVSSLGFYVQFTVFAVVQKYPLKELIEKFEYFKWSADTSAFGKTLF